MSFLGLPQKRGSGLMRWIAVLILPVVLLLAAACGDDGGGPTPTATAPPTDTLPSSATDTPVPAEATEPSAQQQPSGDGLDLRVSVFDDTINRPPVDSPEVWLRGFGSWFPDVTFGSDVVTYEMLVTEGQPDMFIYPDGRGGGTEIPVTFEIPADFIPGSVRDMLQISISDTTVTVFGTAIPGLEKEFAR